MFATTRRMNPAPFTCPRWTSETNAATRPRQDEGRLGSLTLIRFTRIQRAFTIPKIAAQAAGPKVSETKSGRLNGSPITRAATYAAQVAQAAQKKKFRNPNH